MAMLNKGDILVGRTVLTATAAKLSPSYAKMATDPRRIVAEREEAARIANTLSVALAQPHRRGARGRFAGDALAMFCQKYRLRDECRQAGEQFDAVVRAEKRARGFRVIDGDPPTGGELDEEQAQADAEEAIRDYNSARHWLIDVNPKCPNRMELLCYDRLWPAVEDERMLRSGLYALTRYFGLLDVGINSYSACA